MSMIGLLHDELSKSNRPFCNVAHMPLQFSCRQGQGSRWGNGYGHGKVSILDSPLRIKSLYLIKDFKHDLIMRQNQPQWYVPFLISPLKSNNLKSRAIWLDFIYTNLERTNTWHSHLLKKIIKLTKKRKSWRMALAEYMPCSSLIVCVVPNKFSLVCICFQGRNGYYGTLRQKLLSLVFMVENPRGTRICETKNSRTLKLMTSC